MRLVLSIVLLFVSTHAVAQDAGQILTSSSTKEAVATLEAKLKANPADDNARFALGIGQTVRAIEQFAGGLYELGPRSKSMIMQELPFLRLGVPENPNPKEVSAEAIDAILIKLVDDLKKARTTLDAVKDPNVKVSVNLMALQLDLDGDAGAQSESLRTIFEKLRLSFPREGDFTVSFDAGDVCWLRGYTHLLSAMLDVAIAYDKRELIRTTGSFYFQKVQGAERFEAGEEMMGMDLGEIADAIAFIHMLRLPVKDAARLKGSREHLLNVLKESRQSWKLIRAEADNDREWIPNPKQTAVLGGPAVSEEIINGWLAFLDEGEAVLNGEKLIPFWRTMDRGINLRKMFEEPAELDLVMWIQGAGIVKFLEKGPMASGETYRRLEQLLEGNFFMFAVWVN